MMENWRKESLADVINLVLAVWLFLSPWILGYAANAAGNAWVSGILIGIVAIAALTAYFAEWEEWVNLILGLWVAVSPWVIGFADVAAAMWTHVVTGLVVAVIAAVELWMLHQAPPRVRA